MFKKPEIKKALLTICSNEAVADRIMAFKVDENQTDKAFIKEYANKLYSEELYEYLNDNRVDAISAVEFGDNSRLGELGTLLSSLTVKNKQALTALGIKQERICIVNREINAAVHNDEQQFENGNDEAAPFRVYHLTCITESGRVLTISETVYGDLLTIRTLDNSIVPSLGDVRAVCGNPLHGDSEEVSEESEEQEE